MAGDIGCPGEAEPGIIHTPGAATPGAIETPGEAEPGIIHLTGSASPGDVETPGVATHGTDFSALLMFALQSILFR
jgi:hypothetical protein